MEFNSAVDERLPVNFQSIPCKNSAMSGKPSYRTCKDLSSPKLCPYWFMFRSCALNGKWYAQLSQGISGRVNESTTTPSSKRHARLKKIRCIWIVLNKRRFGFLDSYCHSVAWLKTAITYHYRLLDLGLYLLFLRYRELWHFAMEESAYKMNVATRVQLKLYRYRSWFFLLDPAWSFETLSVFWMEGWFTLRRTRYKVNLAYVCFRCKRALSFECRLIQYGIDLRRFGQG